MSAAETPVPAPIRRSTLVRSSREHTFAVFVREIGRWWPLRPYSLDADRAVSVTLTPRTGGEVYETRDDGSTARWGQVLTWEPPARFAMTWEVFGGGTEVEVRFSALGPTLTRVELEHRGWHRLSAEQVRTATRAVGGYGAGWTAILHAFTAAAQAADAPSEV